MIDKKTVFVLGAGASCPYGYPSGAVLRKQICLDFKKYIAYLDDNMSDSLQRQSMLKNIHHFAKIFFKSSTGSIDLFLARNPQLSPTGKYIIAFKIFDDEHSSRFNEEALENQDWYFYLFRRLTKSATTWEHIPDLSDGKIGFVTFNYDRSLEYFLYESLRNSFTNAPEHEIFRFLKGIKIVHVYGQIAPLEWQSPADYVPYAPKISESLLQKAAVNIKTIYEQKESPELNEARQLLAQAERIFFLGFGYAPENLEVLKLPDRTKRATEIYGTAFGLKPKEKLDIREKIKEWLPVEFIDQVNIGYLMGPKNMDCLELLKNYW